MLNQKLCKACGEVKREGEFYLSARGELDTQCKSCRRAKARERDTKLRRKLGVKPKGPKADCPSAPAVSQIANRFLRMPRPPLHIDDDSVVEART